MSFLEFLRGLYQPTQLYLRVGFSSPARASFFLIYTGDSVGAGDRPRVMPRPGDFNVHHEDWFTYSSGTDRPGELCCNFSISNDLPQMVNFPTRIPDVVHIVLLFWTYFFLLMLVFVLQLLSLHWEILIMFLSQFPLTFHQIHNGMPRFIA